jgi:transglutaminase-like putative cysteine protease
MEKRRPQLDFDGLERLRWLLGGVLVLLSVSTVAYLAINAWWLMGITTVGVGTVLVRPTWPARWPGWAHRMAFPAIVAIFIGDIYLTAEVLPPLVRLDALLLFYRGVTYRQRRDDLQIIVLGLFLIVLAGVLTVSLLFAVQIVAFSACALAFLLVITLAGASGAVAAEWKPAGRKAAPRWAHGPWRPLFRRVRAVLDWRIALLGGGLFAGLVLVSALLFMAIPRFELENSLFMERFLTRQARTGFSDHIKFGDVTDIQQDNSVAVSVDVSDPAAIPARPYWRMVVLDDYGGGSFRLSPALRHEAFSRERSEAVLRGTARPRSGPPVYWTFYLEAGVSRYLPLAGGFELLRFRERQNFSVARELGLVALRDDPVSMTAYRVEGMQTGATLPDPSFGAQLRQSRAAGRIGAITQLRLDLPAADRAQLAQVVKGITGGAALAPEELARRGSAWLAARHNYGLQSHTPPGAGDALVRWMVSGEPGHCELFAGAMVLIARAAGVPARIVTGFKGGSWNVFSNNLTLRNADAHAWCELFDAAAQGWRRVDPTPGGTGGPEATQAAVMAQVRRVDRGWSARLDSLRIFWYRRIVSFDQRSQVETFRAVKQATVSAGRRIRAWLAGVGDAVKSWFDGPWQFRRIGTWFAEVLGVVVLLRWGCRYRGGWWRMKVQRKGRLHPVRAEAGRWLRQLRGNDAARGVIGELERLRYGAEARWPRPETIFRQARRVRADARRRRVSPS